MQKMEVSRKQRIESSSSPEPKKESRLTSIIDQLRINKSKNVTQPEPKPKKKDKARSQTPCPQQSDNNESPSLSLQRPRPMPTDAVASSSGPPATALPRGERATPEPDLSSSPSLSPHSPSPGRAFPTLGFGLAGLRAAPFSPPGLERYSPANPAIKQMEMMTRNYSDFMRSLAAKYNQNNAQESFPMSNGLVRGFESTFAYKGCNTPFMVRNMDVEGNGSGCLSAGLNRKVDNQISPTPHENRNNNNNVSSNNSVINPGVVSCGISDFSSSQTLLNLVRTASAQSASQLENYLKGAVKRSADGENRHDPLDLTVANIKRPKLEPGNGRDIRDCRELLQSEAEAALAIGGDCPGNLRTSSVSGSRPSWLTLLDKRMHSSPTSSSRTSPKILNSERLRCVSLCVDKSCSGQSEASELSHWTVDDVVKFVSSVEACTEYAEKFREESIDGSALPLLTEDHLVMYLGLKLGPALKLRSTLARRIGHCAVCMHCVHCHGDDNTDMRRHESSRSPTVSK